MIPLVVITFDIFRNKLEKNLKKELFEYAKKDIDSDILSCLGHINRLFNLDVKTRKSFLRILSFEQDDVNQALNASNILGFQIYKNWGETRNLFQSALRNPLALDVFNTEQVSILIRLLATVTAFERSLFGHSTFDLTGKAKGFKCLRGSEISKYNTSLPNRYILLQATSDQEKFVVTDFGDFEECYVDRVLNTYAFSKAGLTEISANISDIIKLVNGWLESTDNTLIFDPRMFRIFAKQNP